MDRLRSILAGTTERRFAEAELRLEERQEGDDGLPRIVGYAAVYDRLSLPLGFLGGFRERIRAGAFAGTLDARADVPALTNHDSSRPLGRTGSGTLTLEDRSGGLWFDVEPPDTSWARDVIASIRRGDITGSSFEFHATRDAWITINDEDPEKAETVREVIEADLIAVAPAVTFPAYPDASTSVRSILAVAGVDVDRLAGVVFSRARGEEPAGEAREFIRETIQSLQEIERELAPEAAGRDLMAAARRELELEEAR